MQTFIFDVDGTLIDSGAKDRETMRQALAEYGYSFTTEELLFCFGMPAHSSMTALGVRPEQMEAITRRWEELAYRELDKIPVYDGIVDMLTVLRAAGKPRGIVTSRTRAQFERGFVPIGLNGYFDTAVCADEVEHPKPAPDALLACIRRLGGTPEESIYIGDSAYDMQCARAAGVRSALALWGCHEPDKLEADVRLAHPSEILEL